MSTLRLARSNRVLAALPRATLERMLPALQARPLTLRMILQEPGLPLAAVVFPLSGVASMLSTAATGRSVEIATIGCEGMVGLPLLLGGQSDAGEVFVQVAGQGLFMHAGPFKAWLAKEPALMRILLLYTQALLMQVAQCSACTSYHTMSERCARWLLQTHDRVRGDEFILTHEFLSLMLGVRRATVSEAANELQVSGLIRYHRGIVTVLDRAGLEQAACECYRLINREFRRLLRGAQS